MPDHKKSTLGFFSTCSVFLIMEVLAYGLVLPVPGATETEDKEDELLVAELVVELVVELLAEALREVLLEVTDELAMEESCEDESAVGLWIVQYVVGFRGAPGTNVSVMT